MNNHNITRKGRLTESQAHDQNAPLDKTDIIYRSLRGPRHHHKIKVSHGFMGIQNRGVLTANEVHAKTCKNDLVQLLSGGSYFEKMYLLHDAAFTYTKDNHADVFQAFAKNERWRDLELFNGLYIGSAVVTVRGPKKNGFMFTELCKYRNLELFENGLVYNTNNKQPYFLDATNFGGTIGSPTYPVDSELVSNKAIRIGGNKKGIPDSEQIIIHSYKGLKLELNRSARKHLHWIRYDRRDSKEKRVQMFEGIVL